MGGYWQLVFVSCLLVQSLSAEDSAKDNSTSPVNDNAASAVNDTSTSAVNTDEELEKNIGQRMVSLQEMGRDEIRNLSELALEYFNSNPIRWSLFKTSEDATVTVKKAIGSMAIVRLTMEKTNCTKKDVSFGMRFSDILSKEHPKYCGPLAGKDKKQLECKVDIFIDERFQSDRYESEAVVSSDCKPIKVMDKSSLGEYPN